VKTPSRPAALELEALEAREVPSATPTVDLTTPGAFGSVNGAIFTQARTQPSGTGVIDSFVRVTSPGNTTVEQGYNTSARPLAYDENNSPNFTRTLAVADVPSVTIGGARYREFLLDVNQKASAAQLSLDALKIFVSANAAVHGKLVNGNLPDGTPGGKPAAYDLGAGNWVKLDARLSTGSGSSDMVLDVPEAALAGGTYLYLYSRFGDNVGANGGFEEWAKQGPGGGPVVTGVTITGTVCYCPAPGVNLGPVPDGTVLTFTDFETGEVAGTATVTNGQFTVDNLQLGVTYTVTATVLGQVTSNQFTFTSTTAELCLGAGGGG
jgi:hypothetical protein